MMVKLTRSIIDSTKQFHRWKNGSCILTPPQKVTEDEEPIIFSFHSDILNNQSMVNTINQLNSTITKTFTNLNKWLDSWRKYRPLWKVDKVVTLDKFVQKGPTIVHFDEKLTFYSRLAKDVESQLPIKDVDFIRVNFLPLQAAIHSEATSWIAAIGKHLNTIALEGVTGIESKLSKFYEHLQKTPENLDDLTFVLNVIAEIRAETEDVELNYLNILESYRTLDMYAIAIPKEEHLAAESLPAKWEELLLRAKTIDDELIPVKAKFTHMTLDQVRDCKADVKKFKDDFAINGPAAMDMGIDPV